MNKKAEAQPITNQSSIANFLSRTYKEVEKITEDFFPKIHVEEIGRVISVGRGVAQISGLRNIKSEEIVIFQDGQRGLALNLDPDELGIVLLDDPATLKSGNRVYRSERVLDIIVGDDLLGRVINAKGEPIDDNGEIRTSRRKAVEQPAPDITQRSPVNRPLQTGIKVVDALIPIGRGQRELILGDRQTGKTAIAIDTILNQKDKDVICVYCSIGQREANVASYLKNLRESGAMDYSVVLVAAGDEMPGLQYIAPYAATSIAEFFRDQGKDVLIVYDDLTRHARAYRELSLLLRRPPGREAYPGDIFYIHSRLLERSTQLSKQRGGGSLTALPIIETQAQNISAFIPTNLVSITDGQIYLSPDLFQKGVLPAVDVGKSVSRVGGKAQLSSFRKVAGDLRLAYSQFEELEVFSRFGTRLEEKTRNQLQRGQRVREVLKQAQYHSLPVPDQIVSLFAVTEGLFDSVSINQISDLESDLQSKFNQKLPDLYNNLLHDQNLDEESYDKLREFIEDEKERYLRTGENAND